jgi:tryptophan synthase alpha chain
MNRIEATFNRRRAAGQTVLIPYVTAGDPSLAATADIVDALVDAGADIIELGVPFSDPMADGPTIQRSSERALARGVGIDYVMSTVRSFRERDGDTPVVLMGYLNPVEIRGPAAFARLAAESGVDGILLVDLPPEEAREFRDAFEAAGVALILLASPTSSAARIEMLRSLARGYLYYVSFAGVTGAADRLDAAAAGQRLRDIREGMAVPVVAGFGIKDAASASAMARDAEGVVVGSALVAALADAADPAVAARAFLAPLRVALDA